MSNRKIDALKLSNRGSKLRNEYIEELGRLYADTPKAVFAAIALSMCYINVEEAGFPQAIDRLLDEWKCLHENGIVPQKPPKSVGVEIPE